MTLGELSACTCAGWPCAHSAYLSDTDAPHEARVSADGAGGVPVWALIGYLDALEAAERERLLAVCARDYHLPLPAVQAAYRYYLRHRGLIDARIAMNR